MRHTLAFAFALTMLLACSPPKAYVECASDGVTGFNCTVTHQQGSNPINLCWSIKLECANKIKTEARSCQQVDPEGKAGRLVPFTEFKNGEQCDTVTSSAVADLVMGD